jgi:hypothetical protein
MHGLGQEERLVVKGGQPSLFSLENVMQIGPTIFRIEANSSATSADREASFKRSLQTVNSSLH